MKNNSFSKHDNRHTVENFGIYLGGGLGRKQQTDPQKDQHRSDSQLFMHNERNPSGYRLKLMQEGMEGRCSSAMEGGTAYTCWAKDKGHKNVYSRGSTKGTFHRFPHRYSLPKNKEDARPSVNTMWWCSSSPDSELAEQGTDPPSNNGERKVKRNENQRCQTALGHSATTKEHTCKGVTWKY